MFNESNILSGDLFFSKKSSKCVFVLLNINNRNIMYNMCILSLWNKRTTVEYYMPFRNDLWKKCKI